MDHVASAQLMGEIERAGRKKASLRVRGMLLSGFLSGALLAYATAFAFKVSDGFAPGASALVAGAVFPVGFAMIVLLELELVTGNFAVLPVAVARGKASYGKLLRSWTWVFLGNLAGSLFFGLLLVVALTEFFHQPAGALGERIIAVAQSKTLAYEHFGAAGWLTAFVKGVLCNWMVAIGTVLGLGSRSTTGKIVAIWLPIMTFFALALEHSVVNKFVIPAAMMLGAGISLGQWWTWNQIPVTLGNIVGGAVFTGLLLHYIDRATVGKDHAAVEGSDTQDGGPASAAFHSAAGTKNSR